MHPMAIPFFATFGSLAMSLILYGIRNHFQDVLDVIDKRIHIEGLYNTKLMKPLYTQDTVYQKYSKLTGIFQNSGDVFAFICFLSFIAMFGVANFGVGE